MKRSFLSTFANASTRQKNWLYSLFLLLFFVGVYLVRNYQNTQPISKPYTVIQGDTMGGITYHVKFDTTETTIKKAQLDSILQRFNQSLSHYSPDSKISTINKKKSSVILDDYFYTVFKKSKTIFSNTNGAFNPAIGPLIDFWGFGPGQKTTIYPDSSQVDSLLLMTDFNLFKLKNRTLTKKDPRAQLNFSAIAKGYAVDVLFDFLIEKGAQNIYVDIGGECRAKGKNNRNQIWSVGIETPTDSLISSASYSIIRLKDRAIATSGNYRNYRDIEQYKVAHSIDPISGYPTKNTLLSVSILAKDCMTADAYATACMIIGLKKAKKLIESQPNLEGYFIFNIKGEPSSYATNRFKLFFVNTTEKAPIL